MKRKSNSNDNKKYKKNLGIVFMRYNLIKE